MAQGVGQKIRYSQICNLLPNFYFISLTLRKRQNYPVIMRFFFSFSFFFPQNNLGVN